MVTKHNSNNRSLKKTIMIDLDGVLNQYNGEYDKNYIPPINENANNFIKELARKYEVKLFTTRNSILATKWLVDNKLDKYIKDVTKIKELAWIYIDDRTIKFDGSYNNLLKEIEKFKPWYADEN